MAYSLTFAIALGGSQTGFSLKTTLVGTEALFVRTHREIACGLVEIGADNYSWFYDGFPNSFTGTVVIYVGTLDAADDFDGVSIKAVGSSDFA